MTLPKSAVFEITPTVVYFLNNYPLTEAEKSGYDRLLREDDNLTLDFITQQRFWYEFCPRDLKAEFKHGRYLVNFNFYTQPAHSVRSVWEGERRLVYNAGSYTLFSAIYMNRPYKQIADYHRILNSSPNTLFQYIIWLYCLSNNEKQYLINENYRHGQDLVVEIQLCDLCTT